MLYSSAGILALIIHIIINHDVLRGDIGKKTLPAQQAYRRLLIVVSAYFISDILWGVLYEKQLMALTYADTVAYFVTMALSILLWTRFVIVYLDEHNRFGQILNGLGWLVFASQMVAIVMNFFMPVMFSFDENNVYHAQIARRITLAAQIAIFLLTAIYAFVVAHRNKGSMKKRYVTIGVFSTIMAGFSGMQICFPFLPLYGIGWLIGSCVMHSFVLEIEKDEYRDSLEEQLKESILKGNYYDLLTGLSGMTHFLSLMEEEREKMLDAGEEPAFLYMNLSGMKFYNKNSGFVEGDELLKALSARLAFVFGKDYCSRFGSDRFAVFTRENGLEDKIQELFYIWEEDNTGDHLPIRLGIYLNSMEQTDISSSYDRAKAACDSIPATYYSSFQYFDTDMLASAENQHYIISHLDQAIKEKWIEVYYQPIIRSVSGRVCDEEALARWIDPVKGFLSPGDFIPALENAKLAYKLDLYVLERVLEKLDLLKKEGFYLVPQSLNISRSDFEVCDIVEEIRKRVDAAGISHDKITIEITESVIGNDLAIINEQIERFQELGFPVWMDDFGSGYSSLNVLQTIKFNLIKFDMIFMKKLDEGVNGKIILTEMMKLATSLGVDTVCEGVETESQVRFLQEIGCSKLQGYYFCKPIPLEKILERYKDGRQIGFENPEESYYFETISRVNLFDLSVLSNEDESTFQNYFNTIPMGIMEIKGTQLRIARSNQSYRDFMKRFFNYDISHSDMEFIDYFSGQDMSFINLVKQCCSQGSRAFYDEKMPDGSVVHSFVRSISTNKVTGISAATIAVLSISEPDEDASYAEIARALAADYYNIYVVDLDTDKFTEYSSKVGEEKLAIERRGEDFFASSRKDSHRIYEEDREIFYAAFSKEHILHALEQQGSFTARYRLIDTGDPVYMNLKASRLPSKGNRIIIAISNIDAQMKQIQSGLFRE